MEQQGYEDQWQDERDPYVDQQAPSMFQQQEDNENLVKWQLDIKEELIRIERLLRKQIPKRDEKGNVYYSEAKEENQLFNEWGINEILNILAWYLNKTFILSNFDEKTINLRCKQFARRLMDFIHNNYQKLGWDNKEKIKHYEMVVMNLVDVVEATYNRALNGGERESLRTARHVMQSEPINPYMNQGMNQQKKFSLFRPTTWVKK